jgi:hypothetical protein
MSTEEPADPVERGARISRRHMLGWSVAALAATAAGLRPLLTAVQEAAATGTLITARLTRAADQLSLQFDLVNTRLLAPSPDPGGGMSARVVVADTSQPAYLVVRFGPQNIAERAYFEVDPNLPGQGGDETPLLATPVPAAFAGDSRLVFVLPPGAVVPYNPEGLLDWSGLTPSVVPAAARTVAGRPGPQAPSATQTWIEAPWGLVLSPDDGAGWAHAAAPVTHNGRTELWHTRLGVRVAGPAVDEDDATHRTVRAVWAPGYVAGTVLSGNDLGPVPPGRTSLRPRQRYEIVRLSSDWSMTAVNPATGVATAYQPPPIAVRRLMLSTPGAWLDLDGSWDTPIKPADLDSILNTQQWLHTATMGRDQDVTVVEGGFLFPFGHRASLITVTQRQFEPVPHAGGALAGVNRQRMFIVVRETERSYAAGTPFQPDDGRGMPFTRVRITTERTPNLASPDGPNAEPRTAVAADSAYPHPTFGSDAFWPVVATAGGPQDFLFACEGVDAAGRPTPFTAPLIFVSATVSDHAGHTAKLVDDYTAATADRRQRSLGGRPVTLARLDGDSVLPVETITWGARGPDPVSAPLDIRRQPRFFPVAAAMTVHLDAVEQITGKPAAPAAVPISWHPGYLSALPNPGRLFAKLTNPLSLGFPADAIGGIATPDLSIGGLSSLTGVVGGGQLPDIPPVSFDPAAFFAGAAPKLLGALPLTAILGAVDFSALAQIPKLVKTQLPDRVTVSHTWQPKVKANDRIDSPITIPANIFVPARDDVLTIAATATVQRTGGAASFAVTGELVDFALNVFGTEDIGMMTLSFSRLRFAVQDGRKATVDAQLSGVTFHGILEFLNPLQDFLAKLGFVPPRQAAKKAAKAAVDGPPPNGPDVSVTLEGIRAGYTLAVPKIPVGVFSLENLAFSAVVNIPFIGDPARVRFAIADRERPFLVTVAMFGGGGFCALHLGLDGFERFEASLEFGARFGLDLGVASGGVSAMAGIYFALGKPQGELSGYVRINGELCVLGLISLGLEFYLGLSYFFDTGEVSGQARLTVSVDIAFFSTSVTLGPIEKRFGGGSGGSSSGTAKARTLAAGPTPPSVGDLMSPADWADPATGYCAMFAPAAFA